MKSPQMSPRERVLLALSHHETDRVPVDFLATGETWSRLGKHLGTRDRESILRLLGIDLRHPRHAYIGPPLRREENGDWIDEWGVVRRKVAYEGGAYEEIVRHPLAGIEQISELEAFAWPRADWWDTESLLIETLGKGGGFVLSPAHNIQVDTPPENILAVYQEAGSCTIPSE
jgi:hypothetical protein